MKRYVKLATIVIIIMILFSSCMLWDALFGPPYLGQWENVDGSAYNIFTFEQDSYAIEGGMTAEGIKFPMGEMTGSLVENNPNNITLKPQKMRYYDTEAGEWGAWAEANNQSDITFDIIVEGDTLTLSENGNNPITFTRVK